MIEVFVHHSHLYPGARGRLSGPPGDGPALVAFSDGTSVIGRIAGDTLALPAHRTTAGTPIAAKRWRLAFTEDGFKIRARLAD